MYLMIICDILLKGSGEFIHIEFDIVHNKFTVIHYLVLPKIKTYYRKIS